MKTLATFAMLAAIGASAPAMAQQAAPAPAAAPTAQQIAVTDAKVQQFVEVHQEVAEISQTYQAQLQQAGDNAEAAAAISQEANSEMMQAVQASPLTVQEFNQYAMLLQKDQSFQQAYLKHAR